MVSSASGRKEGTKLTPRSGGMHCAAQEGLVASDRVAHNSQQPTEMRSRSAMNRMEDEKTYRISQPILQNSLPVSARWFCIGKTYSGEPSDLTGFSSTVRGTW